MPEMYAGLKQALHRDNCHNFLLARVFLFFHFFIFSKNKKRAFSLSRPKAEIYVLYFSILKE
jgi:hypothetical protein